MCSKKFWKLLKVIRVFLLTIFQRSTAEEITRGFTVATAFLIMVFFRVKLRSSIIYLLKSWFIYFIFIVTNLWNFNSVLRYRLKKNAEFFILFYMKWVDFRNTVACSRYMYKKFSNFFKIHENSVNWDTGFKQILHQYKILSIWWYKI